MAIAKLPGPTPDPWTMLALISMASEIVPRNFVQCWRLLHEKGYDPVVYACGQGWVVPRAVLQDMHASQYQTSLRSPGLSGEQKALLEHLRELVCYGYEGSCGRTSRHRY